MFLMFIFLRLFYIYLFLNIVGEQAVNRHGEGPLSDIVVGQTLEAGNNRWQQRYGPIIHDVTSVMNNQEDNIFSHSLTCFQRLNEKCKNRKIRSQFALIAL